jgi:hypothetical protein
MTPVDKDGYTAADWVVFTINEARDDAVGLWRIIKVGKERFQLQGRELEDFVRYFLEKLMSAGAMPVFGDRFVPTMWRSTQRYGSEPLTIAEAIIVEWREAGVDPDLDGLWFTSKYD